MASEDRNASDALELERMLEAEPYRFDFFEALRRIECAHPGKPRIGQSLRPKDDAVRFGQDPSVAFAPSTLASFRRSKDGRPPRLVVHFFGLLGPNGPLPLHLTEYARDRLRNSGDPTFVRFLDIFHHRLLSLFYRAWASSQPTVSLDRPQSDRFSAYVASLFGLGMPALRGRDAVPDLAKLHYAGQLACQTRHAEGLRAILQEFFDIPVTIQEFVGHWLKLPEDGRSRLGVSPETAALGISTILGARIWDRQNKFRIVMGPMSLADYRRLLPGGDSMQRLVTWVRNYVGDALAWDVNLILKREEVPPLALGKGGQLGWTTWLNDRPLDKDADDLKLDAS